MNIKSAEVKPVSNKPVVVKARRLSKSQRTHVRRMKAEARKEGTVYKPGLQ